MTLQTDTADKVAKIAFHHGVPWEEAYGYAQAIKTGNIIYVSGQLSHDDTGAFVGGAPLDDWKGHRLLDDGAADADHIPEHRQDPGPSRR